VYPHKYKVSSRQTGVKTGVGYKRYIQKYMSDGPLSEVEYRAFRNMWLCRFIFCGKANEPTLNHIVMAEDLAVGNLIPLGKYLLGSVKPQIFIENPNPCTIAIVPGSVAIAYRTSHR
jgi:hypothetical protein